MSFPPSPPCTRSRMKQLFWHLPWVLAGCQLGALWWRCIFGTLRSSGRVGSGAAQSRYRCSCCLIAALPQRVAGTFTGLNVFPSHVWEVVKGELRYWAGGWTRIPQSEPCSSISVCSKRMLKYKAKNSTRRVFSSYQTVCSAACFQQGEFCNIQWEVGAVPQHNLNTLHCLISNF